MQLRESGADREKVISRDVLGWFFAPNLFSPGQKGAEFERRRNLARFRYFSRFMVKFVDNYQSWRNLPTLVSLFVKTKTADCRVTLFLSSDISYSFSK